MIHTKHADSRLNQRGISHAMADLVYAYGFTQGDKVIFNQKAAKERLIEARDDLAKLNKTLDTGGRSIQCVLLEVAALEVELRNLKKLIDNQGAVVVVLGEVLLTAYCIH